MEALPASDGGSSSGKEHNDEDDRSGESSDEAASTHSAAALTYTDSDAIATDPRHGQTGSAEPKTEATATYPTADNETASAE